MAKGIMAPSTIKDVLRIYRKWLEDEDFLRHPNAPRTALEFLLEELTDEISSENGTNVSLEALGF